MEEKETGSNSVPVELCPPSKSIEDIVCNPEDVKEKVIQEALKKGAATKKLLQKGKTDLFVSRPSMILSEWLFLGNARDAFQIDLLQQLGITHVLNVTREVHNYHIVNKKYPIKYAQIIMDDHAFDAHSCIYDYFEATKTFIDECNPALNDSGHKILVHCAAGKSRSSSIIIGYLMSSAVHMNENELNRIQHIRQCLSDDKFVHKIKEGFGFRNIFNEIENNLNEIQKQKLKAIRNEIHNDEYLKLNEAYYYVKSCREIISPNIGFCRHLSRYEKLYQNGEDTFCDLPSFTDWDNDTIAIWRDATEKYHIPYPEVQLSTQNCSCCIVL